MRPTFMGIETAKSSIYTNQKSLDIVGNNLANVDTDGYTRQRVDRAVISVNTASSRVAYDGIGLAGQGVRATNITQTRDAFLDKRFREENSQAKFHEQSASILSDIRSALGDAQDITSESDLINAIGQVYSNLVSFAEDSTSDAEANLVMSAFKNLSQVLSQMNSRLDNVLKQQYVDMSVTTDRVNSILEQVAHINQTLRDNIATDGDYQSNELYDQRNLLLDELSEYADITIKENADGTVDVDMGDHNAIDGIKYNIINLRQNQDGTVAVTWSDTGKNVGLTGGTIHAYLEFLNGRGPCMQSSNETTSMGLPYYRDKIDSLASAFAQVANHTIPEFDEATGQPKVDAEGRTVYKILLAGKTESGKTNSKIPVTAANISVSDEWIQGSASYLIYNKAEKIEDYAAKLSTAIMDDYFTFDAYGETFTGTFSEYLVDFSGKLGTEISFQEGRKESMELVANDFLNQRDEISGVSSNEEAADMVVYQKAYEAAARLMTAMDELLDKIINGMGRVGL